MYILGIMTGTSLDGVDFALVHFDENKYIVKNSATISFPESLHKNLVSLVEQDTLSLDFILQVQSEYNKFIVDEVLSFQKNNTIDLIGFSGQTIRHLPQQGITWQIGSPGILAGATKIKTVGDFRTQDMGAGGQGAPLIAFVDYLLCAEEPTIFLNIGGIANFTYINKKQNVILAFDTGPGNMIIDSLMRILYKKNFDSCGNIASSGCVDQEVLAHLLTHPFFALNPPRSTGRIDFGAHYVQKFLQQTTHLSSEDKIATATAFTIESITLSIKNYVSEQSGKIVVSGGGKRNKWIMENLQKNLGSWELKDLRDFGIDEDIKEAYAFAILAHHAAIGKENQLPQATGASRSLVLGGVYHG